MADAALTCSSCGAHLDSASQRCAYCGATINAPEAAARSMAERAETTSQNQWRKSWTYTGLFVAISLGLASAQQWQARRRVQPRADDSIRRAGAVAPTAARQDIRLSSMLALIAEPDGRSSALFLGSTGGTASEYPLVLLDLASGARRWKSLPYDNLLHEGDVVRIGDKIIVVDHLRVTAIALSDGGVLWQASLLVEAEGGRDGLRVAGQHIAVLLRDGTTQVLDLASGRTVWAHKATPPPRELVGAGDLLLQFGNVGRGRRARREIEVVDITTGALVHGLVPRCSTHSIIPANEPSPGEPLLLSPDGHELYLFYGINRACVERWNLRTGELVWQINRQADKTQLGKLRGDTRLLLSEDRIFYTAADEAVYGIDRATGELRQVVGDHDSHLVPELRQDNLLLVSATPAWEQQDCKRAKSCSLWAVDLAKGTVLWRYALVAAPSSSPQYGRFAARFTTGGLELAQVTLDNHLLLDRLALATGVSQAQKRVKLDANPHLPIQIRHVAYQGDLVQVETEIPQRWMGVDPQTGSLRYRIE